MKKAISVLAVFAMLSSTALAGTNTISLDQLGGDVNTYKGTLDYSASSVSVSFEYETIDPSRLKGTITASGLKPGFTYQVKVLGKPTCLYGTGGDDAANEYIGYKGRWTCADCTGTALSKNRNDAQYVANEAKPDSDPTKECIQGYLVYGFFTTDSLGAATKYVESDSSYHVLWCSGGTCGLADNDYLVDGLCAAANVNGQLERGSCGTMTLDTGTYDVVIALTEESFHQGDWATVLKNENLEFEIGVPPAPALEELDYLDVGDPVSELGHLDMAPDDWSYIGDSVHDGGVYLKHGGYGGYDGGSANFRGLMGPPSGCGEGSTHATFTMDAGTGTATQLVIRHLDGSVADSFDVCLMEGHLKNCFAHYPFDGQTSEDWKTTTFDLPYGVSGEVQFMLVATDPVTAWCELGWGQVMINWIRLDGTEGNPVPAPEPVAMVLALALASPAFAYLVIRKRK